MTPEDFSFERGYFTLVSVAIVLIVVGLWGGPPRGGAGAVA